MGKSVTFVIMLVALSIFVLASFAHSQDVTALNAAIQAKGGGWIAGETSMSRLSSAERMRRLGLKRNALAASAGAPLLGESGPTGSAPTGFDWRSNGGNYVTSVKNQGSCGACWAFATTGATESATLIANQSPNVDLDLSEQVLISCSGAGNCEQGGYVNTASNYIRDTGVALDVCYPYTGTDGTCSMACANWQAAAFKINNWSWVASPGTTPTTNALKNALYTYGPLVTTMAVYSDFFNYVTGVYKYTSGSLAGYHAIIIVGYSDTGGYFIVKNSWGTGWGEAGFFRIAYSELTSPVEFGYETIAYTASQHAFPVLSVSKTGNGSGTVSSYPTGISCGATCSAQFVPGTQVTLTATPDANSTFGGWSGGPCSGVGTCTMNMDASKSVTATFNGSSNGSYAGCYTDSSTRALPNELSTGNETVESCTARAAQAGYAYAGVQYYGQCFAGNALGYTKVADSQCNTPCSANPAEMCGGSWLNSIYATGVNPSGYAGCYTDTSTRALPNELSTGGETVESCKTKAAQAGYAYAGVQYYGQCFAGNALGYTKVADSQCNT
ncbi:MAG TPA: C1 family peptidase, partial [Syntrophorhabdales bacterium]|nr:C1 family peptidase [Syntrophorhabdales bacterium]